MADKYNMGKSGLFVSLIKRIIPLSATVDYWIYMSDTDTSCILVIGLNAPSAVDILENCYRAD